MKTLLEKVRKNLRAGKALNDGIDAQEWQKLLDRYSRFVDHRNEAGFVTDSKVEITDFHTPRPCLHLMASNHDQEFGTWGSFWDQFGGGFSCKDSVLAGRMTSHLDTNYVPTAPEPQDVRSFYIHENGRAWPMFLVPNYEEDRYRNVRCEQGLDRQSLEADREKLSARLEVCVHPDLPLETYTVTVTNTDSVVRRFSWFMKLRVNIDSFPFYYFVPRVVCEGILEEGTMVFLNHDKGNKHSRQAFFAANPTFAGFDMMGEVFEGIGGRSTLPAAVQDGRCRNSLGQQPYAGLFAAAQFDAVLQPGETQSWVAVYGACPYAEAERKDYIRRVREKVLSGPAGALESVRQRWTERVERSMVKTSDADFDRYYNVWSKYQARNQSRFCRALDKIGYRDVLQDLLGICDFDPGYVRTMLLRTLHYQMADGRAIRQYGKFAGSGHDLRMYMDSSSWLPDLLTTYLRETGDFGLLDEKVPYFDLETLEPDEKTQGTVYEHALRAVQSLAKHTGYHGLCKIGYGDWNDALSGIGGEKGVSVWLSCACVYAAGKMAELAEYLGRNDDAKEMRQIAETMREAVNAHAWDGGWYWYAINGQGKSIGSHTNPEGRIHLNVNTWALFTGIAESAGRSETVWKALKELDTPLGHRLLSPPYTSKSRSEVGRIADQQPGMIENGSIYIHGEAFFLYALICGGKADECYQRLMRVLPSSMVQELTTGPRHQQANFTVGPDSPNFGMQLFSNFTGSLAWFRKVIERMLGVWADFDALVIEPSVPADWREYDVVKSWRGRKIHVVFKRGGESGCRIRMAGREYDGRIPFDAFSADRVNEIDVTYC